MSDQDNGQVTTLQRPISDDPDAWKEYWTKKGWLWRREPEIDADRQNYLGGRRAIVPDIEKGIYPFKDVKLSRADVKWLLVTHEDGRGPVDWNDESQRERKGLNLRGAILSGVNLSGLPLACMLGGLTAKELFAAINESSATDQRDIAAVHLEEAVLTDTHLEGANLSKGHLEEANARRAYLEKANLQMANLEGAILSKAHLNASR